MSRRSDDSEFVKGIKQGLYQTKKEGYSLASLTGQALGLEGLRQWGQRGALQTEEQMRPFEAAVPVYTQITTPGEALQFGLHGLGTLVPTVATSLAGAGVGGILGKAVAKGAAARLAGTEVARRGVPQAIGKEAAEQIARGTRRGAYAGLGAATTGMETGEIFGEMEREGVPDPLRALGYGAAAGALDVVPAVILFRRFGLLRPRQVAEAVLAKEKQREIARSTVRGYVGDVLKQAGAQAAIESGTEGIQTVLERQAIADLKPEYEVLTGEGKRDIINAMLIGGLGGGVFGGVGGVFNRPRTRTEERARAAGLEGLRQEMGMPDKPAVAPPPEPVESPEQAAFTFRDTLLQGGMEPERVTTLIEQVYGPPREMVAAPPVAQPKKVRALRSPAVIDLTPLPTAESVAPKVEGEDFLKNLPGQVETAAPQATASSVAPPLPEAPEPSAPPPPSLVRGGQTTFVPKPGRTQTAEWALVEVDELQPQYQTGALQPRNRGRIASEEQIEEISRNPQYALLSDSPTMDRGATTIGARGEVVGGHARLAGLQRAYTIGTADNYRRDLEADAQAKGFDPAVISRMRNPGLFRQVTPEADLPRLALLSNVPGPDRLSLPEQARVDADLVGDLRDFYPSEAGEIATKENRDFIRRFVSQLPRPEQSALKTADGLLSQEGLQRIRNAVLYKAYADEGLLARMVESPDNPIRNVTTALLRVAPQMAQAREQIRQGTFYPADLAPDLVQAVNQFAQLRQAQTPVSQFLRQQQLFGTTLTPEARQLLPEIERRSGSAKQLAAYLQGYLQALKGRGHPQQQDFLGKRPAPTKQELLAEAGQAAVEPEAPLFAETATPAPRPATPPERPPAPVPAPSRVVMAPPAPEIPGGEPTRAVLLPKDIGKARREGRLSPRQQAALARREAPTAPLVQAPERPGAPPAVPVEPTKTAFPTVDPRTQIGGRTIRSLILGVLRGDQRSLPLLRQGASLYGRAAMEDVVRNGIQVELGRLSPEKRRQAQERMREMEPLVNEALQPEARGAVAPPPSPPPPVEPAPPPPAPSGRPTPLGFEGRGEPVAAPRATHPDGRLIPLAGDEVYQTVAGPFGTPAVIHGTVYPSGSKLRVRVTGGSALIGEAPKGKTYALHPAWTVRNDPEITRREEEHAAKKTAEEQARAEEQRANKEKTRRSFEAAIARGERPLTQENAKVGLAITFHSGVNPGEQWVVTERDAQGEIYGRPVSETNQYGGYLGKEFSTQFTVPPVTVPAPETVLGVPIQETALPLEERAALLERAGYPEAAEKLKTGPAEAVISEKPTPYPLRRDASPALTAAAEQSLATLGEGAQSLANALPTAPLGVRTLGVAIRRDLINKGRVDLRGQRVRNAEDLAALAQVFRNPTIETFRVFYVKGSEIVAHEGVTSRMPGTSRAFTTPMSRGTFKMRERMRRLGADGYYLLHNHPSGNPNPSADDLHLTRTVASIVPGFNGHIVIDSGKWTITKLDRSDIKPARGLTRFRTEIVAFPSPAVDLLLTPEIPHDLLGKPISGPTDLAIVAHALRKSLRHSVAVFYTDSRSRVRAIQDVPLGLMRRTEEAAKFIRGQARAFGGVSAFAYLDEDFADNRKATLTLIDAGILRDAIVGPNYVSLGPSVMETSEWMGIPKPTAVAVRDVTRPAFYSALTRAIEGVKPAKAPAAQWKALVKNLSGVRQEEVKWAGLNEWLDEQKGSVTKEQVLDFLRANEVRVQEVVKGDNPELTWHGDMQRGFLAEDGAGHSWEIFAEGTQFTVYRNGNKATSTSTLEGAKQFVSNDRAPTTTKFSSYQLPGGESYRELLLTLPSDRVLSPEMKDRIAEASGKTFEETALKDLGNAPADVRLAFERHMLPASGGGRIDFVGGHFDVPNVLAHVRFNERTDADGKRVLFIEEVQSDWAQKGRREGFDLGKPTRRYLVRERSGAELAYFDTELEADGFVADSRRKGLEVVPVTEPSGKGVPHAPFVGKTESWVLLAMKRMIRYAAESGSQAWRNATQPYSFRAALDNLFGSKDASKQGLSSVEASVLRVLQHDQVRDAVVSAIPVDVMNTLTANGVTADQLISNSAVILHALPADARATVSAGIKSALGKVGTRLRAALNSSLPAGRDFKLLGTLKASDLDASEVVGLLSPLRISDATTDAGVFAGTGATAKFSVPPTPGDVARVGDELSSASLAKLLDSHAEIIGNPRGSVKFDPGYEKIAWATGEQQAARYDLSKHIDALRIAPGDASNREVVLTAIKDNRIVIPEGGGALRLARERLAHYIGKDLAQRAIQDLDRTHEVVNYSGLDLEVGGESMKAFYDQMLPSMVNEYVKKKWGGKVGETRVEVPGAELSTAEHAAMSRQERDDWLYKGVRVPSIDITPAMRESVMQQGQPLFRVEAAPGAEPLTTEQVNADLFADVLAEIQRIAAPGTAVRIRERLTADPERHRKALEAWSRGDLGERAVVTGAHRVVKLHGRELRSLIALSLESPDLTQTARHEAWHSVHLLLLTDDEQRVMNAAYPARNGMASEERAANAFAEYLSNRRALIPKGIREIFERVRQFLTRLQHWLQGRGYQTAEDLFERAATGELRQRGVQRQAVEFLDTAFSLDEAAQRRAETEGRAYDPTIRQRLKEETQALLVSFNPRHFPYNTAWENLLRSPEFWEHPVLKQVVQAGIDRQDWFHETFNYLDRDVGGAQVTQATEALARQGISRLAAMRGKRSQAYRDLHTIIERADTERIRYTEDQLRAEGYGEETVRVWRMHRDLYDRALDLQMAPLRELVRELKARGAKMPDFLTVKEPDGTTRAVTLEEALTLMGEYRGTYAPRLREQGEWAVLSKRGEEKYRHHAVSRRAAERLKHALQHQGHTVQEITPIERLPESIYQSLNVMETQAAIEKAVEGMEIAHPDLQIRFLSELVTEMSDLIKARGARSSMIRRQPELIRGYLEDPQERLVRYMSRLSGGFSKARAAREMFQAFFGRREGGQRVGGVDPSREPRVYETGRAYILEQLRNADQTDRWVGWAKSVATFKYLGFNPKSAVVNLSALLTTVPAALHAYAGGGRIGFGPIFSALNQAGRDYLGVMRGRSLSNAEEQAFLRHETEIGALEAQFTREALGHIEGAYGKLWGSMTRGAMWLFGKTEQFNRGATMLAAYRIARQRGLSSEQAQAVARETSNRAHGIYGKATNPIWAQGQNVAARLGQLFYVFSKFPHTYLQMLYEVGFKRKDIRAALYALLAPVVLSGAMVIPFKEALYGVAGAIMGALGDKRDPEKLVYDTIREELGHPGERVARYGALGALGVNISGSLMIGTGIPRGFADLAGAFGGVAEDLQRALEQVRVKEYGRALERAAPTAFGSLIRATRELKGATTPSGRPIWDEQGNPYFPSAGETALRGLSVASPRQSALSARTREAKREVATYTAWRERIYRQYRSYLQEPDPAIWADLVQSIQAYNQQAAQRGGQVPLLTRQALQRQIRAVTRPTRAERAMRLESA